MVAVIQNYSHQCISLDQIILQLISKNQKNTSLFTIRLDKVP